MADPVEPGAVRPPPSTDRGPAEDATGSTTDSQGWIRGPRTRTLDDVEPMFGPEEPGRLRRRSGRGRGHRWIVLAVLLLAALAVGGYAAYDELREEPPRGGQEYDATKVADLEARAARGLSHVVYARSPGSAEATARRVATFRARIEEAVAGTPIPADIVEAIVFIESGGRPDVIAGADQDPQDASGLTQIVASTGTDFLDMRIDLEESRRLTNAIASARSRGDREELRRLLTQRRRIDDRFDPVKALRGTVRYLLEANRQLGRMDLAVTSYHMGIGNLSNAVRAWSGAGSDVAVPGLVEGHDLSYARLYFGSSPLQGAAAWKVLAELNDDSSNYYWKVLASKEIMRLYRQEPDRLAELVALHGRGGSAPRVFHPAGDVDTGAARPQTVATQAWMAAIVARVRPDDRPLEVLQSKGWTFDVRRRYASEAQATAFQFVLDRLTALDLITWERRQNRIHITVSSEAGVLAEPAPEPEPE